MAAFWPHFGRLATSSVDLRLRSLAYQIRISRRRREQGRRARFCRAAGRVPRLRLTFCRCMNIAARYCTGYLGDIGVPADPAPMDFSAWFEVFLGSGWYTFDARHNQPRIGRILIARGRDAADVPISTAFGQSTLSEFTVVTHELVD